MRKKFLGNSSQYPRKSSAPSLGLHGHRYQTSSDKITKDYKRVTLFNGTFTFVRLCGIIESQKRRGKPNEKRILQRNQRLPEK